MAFQEINRGTGADTGDGDSLRAGGLKVNTNFGEIYNAIGTGSAAGSTICTGISASATVITLTAPVLSNATATNIKGGGNNTNGHTVPNLADDTFTLIGATQTLTGKTLTNPTINAATLTGTVASTATVTGTLDLSGTVLQGTNALVFEGSGDDAHETTLAITNPTVSDKTITFPDTTGTVLLDSTLGTFDYTVGTRSMSTEDWAQESGVAASYVDGINTESTIGDKLLEETDGDNLKMETPFIKILTTGGAVVKVVYGAI